MKWPRAVARTGAAQAKTGQAMGPYACVRRFGVRACVRLARIRLKIGVEPLGAGEITSGCVSIAG